MITKLTRLKSVDTIYYTAIALVADKKLESGRIYPKEELKKACAVLSERIGKTTMVGELGAYPDDLKINLDNASHKLDSVVFFDTDDVEDVSIDGFGSGYIRVIIVTLPTEKGKTLKKMLDSDVDMFLSMRASGIADDNGVVSELDFLTFDVDVRQNMGSYTDILKPRW